MEEARLVSSLTTLDLTKRDNELLFVCSEAVESKPVKLETSHTVILSTMVSVLCKSPCVRQANNHRAVVVAQLVKRFLPTPEDPGSNPAITNFITKNIFFG